MSSVPEQSTASGPLALFVALVSVLGFLAVAHSLAMLPVTPHPVQWVALGVLATIASAFALRVPGVPAHVSVSDTFFFTSALLFGSAPATVAVAIDSFLISWRRRHSVDRVLFNTASPALGLWVGSQTFYALADTPPLSNLSSTAPGAILLPLAVMAGLYFILNTGLAAVAVALERGQPPFPLWRQHFAVVSLCHFAAASASFFLVAAARSVSVAALGAALPLLVIFQIAMRSWWGRVEDAQRHIVEVDRLHLASIEALSTAIKAKDGVTSSHVRRVQRLALALARALGIEDVPTLKAIQAASLLHDIGKLAVPERILNKPGALTPAELETIKLHVNVGADILASIDFPYPVAPIVRSHHENWDGSGYPLGLRGDEIPIGARILSVVDSFDAITSDRPYKTARSDQEALAIILEQRGHMYDPVVVDAFARVHRSVGLEAVAQPELDEAVRQISRSVATEASRLTTRAPATDAAVAPKELLALMSLSRVVVGRPTVDDVALLAWTHLQGILPAVSAVFFVPSGSRDEIVVRFATGAGMAGLRGRSIGVGQHLSGWVAAHRQPIVNSDARLDLGAEGAASSLRYAVSFPLSIGEHLAGVVTLYGPNRFSDDHVRSMLIMAPHLAEMIERAVVLEERVSDEAVGRDQRSDLHIIASH